MEGILQACQNAWAAAPTKEHRIREVYSGYMQAFGETLDYAAQPPLPMEKAGTVNDLAQQALSSLEIGRLKEYSLLSAEAYKTEATEAARELLEPQKSRLLTLREAAGWLVGVQGVSALPSDKVTSQHQEALADALKKYEFLSVSAKEIVGGQALSEVNSRYQLAQLKRKALADLFLIYSGYREEDYHPQDWQSLSQIYEQSQLEIEGSADSVSIQQCLLKADQKMEEIPDKNAWPETPTPEPEPGWDPEDPDSSSDPAGPPDGSDHGEEDPPRKADGLFILLLIAGALALFAVVMGILRIKRK